MLKSLCCKERNNLLNIKTPGMQSLHLLIKLKIMKKIQLISNRYYDVIIFMHNIISPYHHFIAQYYIQNKICSVH